MRQRSPVDRGQFDFALGAVLLARRKSAGRWVTAGAALAVLVFQLVEYGARSGILPTSGASPLSTLSSVIPPITLIIVVLTGSAAAGWTKAGRAANPQSTPPNEAEPPSRR
jgi:hypothetical protein